MGTRTRHAQDTMARCDSGGAEMLHWSCYCHGPRQETLSERLLAERLRSTCDRDISGHSKRQVFCHLKILTMYVCDKINKPAHDSPYYDKLYKIRFVGELLACKLHPLFNIGPEVTINKATVPYKGRIGFKQYMRDKPTKWEIKVWTLSDAKLGMSTAILSTLLRASAAFGRVAWATELSVASFED